MNPPPFLPKGGEARSNQPIGVVGSDGKKRNIPLHTKAMNQRPVKLKLWPILFWFFPGIFKYTLQHSLRPVAIVDSHNICFKHTLSRSKEEVLDIMLDIPAPDWAEVPVY